MIELTRGDNKKIIVKRINKSDGQVIKQKPDKMYFTVKYDYNMKEALFQKQLDDGITFNDKDYTYTIDILPKDTRNLPYGKLLFDIEIIINDIVTTLYKGEIELTGEVTHDCNEIDIEEIDYARLTNKPKINGVILEGDKSTKDLKIDVPDTSEFVTNESIKDFIRKDVEDLDNYTKTTDLERDYAKKDEIPDTSNFITDEEVDTKLLTKADKSEIPSLENYYEKTETYSNTEIDEKIDEETSDLLQGLSRELKPDEENGGFSPQTIVSVRNKSGATEMIMEIDNLDVKTDVATNSVLGTLKGQDLEDRVKTLEETPIKVIEINAEMTEDNKTNHEYPELQLNEDQVKIVLNNNISILKVNYNITDHNNGTETDTLVFYTTIDDEKVVSGRNTIDTIKINAIRRNNEGILVYHGEMVGNGSEYYQKVTLTATYNANQPVAATINTKQSMWS